MKKIPITEFRRDLRTLVKRVREDPTTVIQITVHDEPVAELRAVAPSPLPGAAAERLLALRKRLASLKPRGRETDVSTNVKKYLYGRPGRKR